MLRSFAQAAAQAADHCVDVAQIFRAGCDRVRHGLKDKYYDSSPYNIARIIKAEEEAGKGVLKIHVWRDRNWVKRTAARDMFGVDLDALFKEAEDDEDKTLCAKDMVQMGLARLDGVKPITPLEEEVNDSVMVVGSGRAGLEAAVAASGMGHRFFNR